MRLKIKIAVILFILGFAGVLTLMTTNLFSGLENYLPQDALEELEKIPKAVLKLLTLIQPTILLLIAIIIGVFTYKKAGLTLPIIEGVILKQPWKSILKEQLKYGILGGVIAGSLIVVTSIIFRPYFPEELIELERNFQPSLLTRFIYGGITEEIFVRFGVLSLFVWIGIKIIGKPNNFIYWIAIVLSSIIFAFGHFPIVFLSVKNPTIILLTYILLANSIGGVIFGWLYWKKGLESAFIAHIIVHVIFLLFS